MELTEFNKWKWIYADELIRKKSEKDKKVVMRIQDDEWIKNIYFTEG